MSNPMHPKAGDKIIDVSDIELKDITPEHIGKLTKMREGHGVAILNLLESDPAARKRAGLSEPEVEELAELWTKYQRIEEVLPAAEKLAELLHETRMLHGHAIGAKLGEMANQIRRRADRVDDGAEVVGPFEALLAYQFAPAQKAAATRAKAETETEAEAAG